MQAKNLHQMTITQMDAFIDSIEDLKATASLHALTENAKSRVFQDTRRMVCMRMLMLMAEDPSLLQLYKDSNGGTDRKQTDAGANPLVNPGQGMGPNHTYHFVMAKHFNDSTIVNDFPFEHIPQATAIHSDGKTVVHVPAKIKYAFIMQYFIIILIVK
jgi:hypothetical protein